MTCPHAKTPEDQRFFKLIKFCDLDSGTCTREMFEHPQATEICVTIKHQGSANNV